MLFFTGKCIGINFEKQEPTLHMYDREWQRQRCKNLQRHE
jgi:hypothetical protein